MGRHELAVAGAIDAARTKGLVTDVDDGAITLLLAGARSLDVAEDTAKPYVAANVLPAMLSVFESLHMTVESRASTEKDGLDDLLDELSKPA